MHEGSGRLLVEQEIGERSAAGKARPSRSVMINLAESPLGWLKARGHISQRQYDAGEQLTSTA